MTCIDDDGYHIYHVDLWDRQFRDGFKLKMNAARRPLTYMASCPGLGEGCRSQP
ncbi:hypothetical protein T10_10120 [Trichinella papuae]|uniref:Uncharacterized protein n=1 Tax=Trichinella papuae TaxID=268474 RepID=A0A0V1M3Z6_9BILA|nr:hypothetical protein T10_5291 [Trichinella papuae]KRZ66440.1 hypothetical protein T10_1971 [Trichinella papuae]KRZ75993.1 hypothetical protein T10_10120 [Trichinella papuae]